MWVPPVGLALPADGPICPLQFCPVVGGCATTRGRGGFPHQPGPSGSHQLLPPPDRWGGTRDGLCRERGEEQLRAGPRSAAAPGWAPGPGHSLHLPQLLSFTTAECPGAVLLGSEAPPALMPRHLRTRQDLHPSPGFPRCDLLNPQASPQASAFCSHGTLPRLLHREGLRLAWPQLCSPTATQLRQRHKPTQSGPSLHVQIIVFWVMVSSVQHRAWEPPLLITPFSLVRNRPCPRAEAARRRPPHFHHKKLLFKPLNWPLTRILLATQQ